MKPDDNGILGEGLFFNEKYFLLMIKTDGSGILEKTLFLKCHSSNGQLETLYHFFLLVKSDGSGILRETLSKDDIKRMSNLKLLNCLIS
jgi:hypothetical protein